MQSIGTSISVPFFGSQVSGGAGYAAFNYVATPTFTTRHGYGNKANNRADLRPTGRRIIIDGTTSIVGNYYRVASFAAAKAAYNAPGDWILLPGGTTGTVIWGDIFGNGQQFSGSSATNMFVMGTFDPAHNTNSAADEAFYNTLRYTFDLTGSAPNTNILSTNTTNAGQGNIAFVNLGFKAGASSAVCLVGMLTSGSPNLTNWLFENCVFDGVTLDMNAYSVATTPFTANADNTLLNDITLRYCGFMYGNGSFGGRLGNLFVHGAKRLRIEACITHHGGWSRGMTRATPPWNPGIDRAITTLTSATTTATATVASTAAMVTGNWVNINSAVPTAYNGNYQITILNGTQFSYTFVGGVAAASTPGFYENLQENGWSAAAGDGPDAFKHGFYITEFTDDVGIYDCVSSAGSADLKLTGGTYWVQNLVSIHDPISWISSPRGNNGAAWPAGSTIKSQNHLQVGSDYGNSFTGLNYGWAPQLYACIAGSYYSSALILTNDAPSVINSQGFFCSTDGSVTYPTSITFNNNVIYNWPGQLNSPNPDAYTTATYTNNIWPIATSGSNTIVTSMPALYQTRIAAAAALNTHTTLRTTFSNWFSGVAVGGSNAATEVNMFEFMCNNPIPGAIFADPNVTSWATLFQYHFRSKLAGVT